MHVETCGWRYVAVYASTCGRALTAKAYRGVAQDMRLGIVQVCGHPCVCMRLLHVAHTCAGDTQVGVNGAVSQVATKTATGEAMQGCNDCCFDMQGE